MAELDHFAIMSIAYQRFISGIQVLTATNNPCHLTLYYTASTPLTHKVTRIQRGLPTPWGAYWCFAGWTAVPQDEAGDTLNHTFSMPDWSFCLTRWFTFRGNVAGVLSPSCGPIIKHHNDLIPYTRYQFYDGISNTAFLTSATTKLAQTFTPQTPHSLTQLRLLLSRSGLPGIMNIAIEGTLLTGRPDDTILTTGTFDGDALPPLAPDPPEWITIPISPLTLPAGTMYAIVLYGGDNSNQVAWRAQDLDPYPRGRAWGWFDPPGNWFGAGTFDHLFEDWGLPI